MPAKTSIQITGSQVVIRVLLLALLPVIGALLYLTGQKYDPALINFQSTGSDSVNGASTPAVSFPAEIDGFMKAPQMRAYTKDNLYEYIDGHADYFITNGFNSLSVAEYSKSQSGTKASDATIDVYDMGSPLQAFGVLTDEASSGAAQVEAGVMGFQTSQGVNFFKGRYYVKINVFSPGVNPLAFAAGIDKALNVKAEPFPLSSLLPDLGKVVSTRYVKADYRGLDFIGPVIEREYDSGSHKLQVALSAGTSGKDAEGLVLKFMAFFDKSKVKYETLEAGGRKYYMIHDPYEGDWLMVPVSASISASEGSRFRTEPGRAGRNDVSSAFYAIYGVKSGDVVPQILDKVYDAIKK